MAVSAWLIAPGAAHASEHYLEIDVSQPVLAEVVDGQVAAATHVSTGSGEDYWLGGALWDGETQRGWFQIYAKDPGWVEGALGSLCNAMYFYEGFAIHGAARCPTTRPATAACG